MRTIYRDIVGAFILSKDDHLVVGKSIKGGVYADTWIIPGGGIEADETQIEALKREVMEEVGLDIADAEIKQILGDHAGESEKTLRDTGERVLVKMNFYNYTVRLSENAKDITLTEGDDFMAATWLPSDAFVTTTFSPPTIVVLKKLGYQF